MSDTTQSAQIIILALASAATGTKAFQEINSYQVPIYYTWVERDNRGQNALPRGMRTGWNRTTDPLITSPEPDPVHNSALTNELLIVVLLIAFLFCLLNIKLTENIHECNLLPNKI